MRALQFTQSAEADVDAILRYTLATWGDAQAEACLAGRYDLLALFAENPESGRLYQGLASDLRGFPYREHLIFYLPLPERLLVIRILHARQNIALINFAK